MIKPFAIGSKYDGQTIIEVEVVNEEILDDYQPYCYLLSNGETVWIPIDSNDVTSEDKTMK